MNLMHFSYRRLLPTALLALACGSLHGQTLDTLARELWRPRHAGSISTTMFRLRKASKATSKYT